MSVRGVVAAFTLAATVGGVGCAAAAGGGATSDRGLVHLLLFSGTDLWSQGAFLYGGTVWAPHGFASDSFVVKLLADSGSYRYRSGALGNAEVVGRMIDVTAMAGMHLIRGPLTMSFYAGPDFQFHRLTPDDPGNPARGSHLGARAAAEFWYQATPTFVVSGSAMATTIASATAERLALGWRVFHRAYVGPEVETFTATNYDQWRIGVHVTGLTFATFKSIKWQGAIGYAADNDGDDGLYARFGLLKRM